MKFSISYKTVNDSDVARNWHEGGADLRENNLGVTTQNQQKDAENNACILRPLWRNMWNHVDNGFL